MPLYLQLNKCLNPHGSDTWNRFDPARSDSNYPTLFCSFRCEKEWVESCLADLTLADAVDIQTRARAVAGTRSISAIAR
jgi:hypothetical protein